VGARIHPEPLAGLVQLHRQGGRPRAPTSLDLDDLSIALAEG